MARRSAALIVAAVVVVALGPSPAAAESVRAIGTTLVPVLERAEDAARPGDPGSMQTRYNAARAIVEALRGRTSPDCGSAAAALSAYAWASIAAAEAFDRMADRTKAETWVGTTRDAARRALSGCASGRLERSGAAAGPALLEPADGEAFAGLVRARTPAHAVRAELWLNGTRVVSTSAGHPGTAVRIPATRRGPTDVELRFLDVRGVTIVRGRASGTWLLPPSAEARPRGSRRDARLDARLGMLGRGFSGYSAVVVHDLARGRAGSWNGDARFPAASTVKLGVLIAGVRATGRAPERSAGWYDLVQLAGWSSNLAANRLFGTLGRSLVETTLRRMGAGASTYPGVYRVGTAHEAARMQPPLVSPRVTTARDLAAVLETIHGAAFGDPDARRRSGLTRHQARLALGLLLASKPIGDNAGLFHAALPPSMPVAQKHGWLSDAFHTAAILYTPSGPVVCVLLTYRDGLSRTAATRLGADVVDAALHR